MIKGLLDLHNLLRWIILILLFINIVQNFADKKKPFGKSCEKWGLWLMISAHLTLVVGLILLGNRFLNLPSGVNIMKDDALRFVYVEHPFGMIVAIVLITLGKGVARKKITDTQKHNRAFWLFLIALIIILAMIPWKMPLVPGM